MKKILLNTFLSHSHYCSVEQLKISSVLKGYFPYFTLGTVSRKDLIGRVLGGTLSTRLYLFPDILPASSSGSVAQ